MRRLIIVVPVYKPSASEYEDRSLRQLYDVCGKYDVCFFHPEGLDLSYYKSLASTKTTFKSFPKKYFQSLETYSKLLMKPSFYKAFSEYDYMLIYQPDAFIFRDELEQWMEADYDYIGAPFWFYYTTIREKAQYGGVGNGGFSLRKISSMQRVLNSWGPFYDRRDIDELKANKNFKGRMLYEGLYWLGKIGIANNTWYWLNAFSGYEDYFWGCFAGPKKKWMKFPEYKEAMKFAFEFNCVKMFEENNHQLPMGCHRWWGEDKEFWKPHFRKYNIEIK
ncbi:MAG TPA: DUF5672 family protein [Cyclobacteriaceae bacterium]|nr:DUF5672 family protein [Cyclobacteriaceae bacterium]